MNMMLFASRSYLANTKVDRAQIDSWAEQFHRDGFLFLPNVLPPDVVAGLKSDLDNCSTEALVRSQAHIDIAYRMFESSRANLELFGMEPIVSLAEALIGDTAHVIHNNSFRSPVGGGGVSAWHQDDPPHYLVTHGEPPANVNLPVIAFAVNYYLTDVDTIAHGPTEIIRGSHLFGKACPPFLRGSKYDDRLVSCIGPAGSAVLNNSQVWHRGAPNTSDRTRYLAQVTYGRRIIPHTSSMYVNYTMPAHVYEHADTRLRRLLGFPPSVNDGSGKLQNS